ncbi:MAG: SpoIIE family protein phosphatase [Bacteroidia bacterium]|nr:SpoIIE family protein phosphatase [Bacteroidia bacterium]
MISILKSKVQKNFALAFCVINKEGKVVFASPAWQALDVQQQERTIQAPTYEFVCWSNHYYQKIAFEEEGHTQIYLVPADDYFQVLQENEKLKVEIAETKQKINTFIQKSPYPLLVVNKEDGKIIFANQLLLDLFKIPLAAFYKGLFFKQLFSLEQAEQLLQKIYAEKNIDSYTLQISIAEKTRWLIVRAFHFELESLKGFIVSFVDISEIKEKEIQIMELNEEIHAQNEELRQTNDVLHSLYEAVDRSYKEIRDSLISGQRIQKLITQAFKLGDYLPREHFFHILKPHSYVSGDFFWLQRKGDFLYIAVGDATGHGVSGGLLATTFSVLLSQFFNTVQTPDQIHIALSSVHNAFLTSFLNSATEINVDGADLFVVALPLNGQKFFYYTAAHAKAILKDPFLLPAKYSVLRGEKYPVGFYVEGQTLPSYRTYRVEFSENTTLFLFTDGIPDMINAAGKKLGIKGFIKLLESWGEIPVLELESRLLEAINNNYQPEGHQNDDIQVVGIQLPLNL